MANDTQEEADTKFCSNCKRDIPSINYVMHQNHCARNIKLCEHCQEPVPRSEMEAHFEEEHKKVPCKCGESIEISKLEEHQAKHCTSRPVNCDYCELELPFAKIAEHKEFCGSRTELCAKCNRYIQLKDLDVHTVSDCKHPETVPTQSKTKPLSHFNDHADGLGADVLASEWHGMWRNDVQSLFTQGNTQRSSDDLFDLISPMSMRGASRNPNREGGGVGNRTRTSHHGGVDRKHVKNQDRVQNSFGVTSMKTTSGAKTTTSRISRPWEKNEERQQNISQEESDRLLAMHLAQDLRGSKLSPEEHLNTFIPQDMIDFTNEIDVDQMFKENYTIPTVNTYQEPKFTVSSPTESTDVNSTMLPCEFCQECYPSDILIEHQSGCRPDVSSYAPTIKPSSTNNNRQQPLQGLSGRPQIHDNLGQNVSSTDWMYLPACPADDDQPERTQPSIDAGEEDDDNSVMLPCEFCGDLLPSEFLTHHQVNCTENGTQTPVPPSMDTNPVARHAVHSTSSPTRLRPRKVPIPTSLDLNHRPVKHQTDPILDVLMASPDSKPANDESSPRLRQAGQPRNRKTKVTSTVTKPTGHGVNLAVTSSPGDKYLNGSPSDRDVNNGIIAPKPRVVTGKTAKSPGYSPSSLTSKDLNNRQKQPGKVRTKPLKTSSVGRGGGGGEVLYHPSFGASSEDKRRGSREKNNQHGHTKPSNKSRHHHSAAVVNIDADDDDLGPPLRLKSSNLPTGGAKPKHKRSSKKPDNDTV